MKPRYRKAPPEEQAKTAEQIKNGLIFSTPKNKPGGKGTLTVGQLQFFWSAVNYYEAEMKADRRMVLYVARTQKEQIWIMGGTGDWSVRQCKNVYHAIVKSFQMK